MNDEQTVVAQVRDWFEQWGRCVAAVDFDSARTLFDPSVVGFGTYQDVVDGLDALEAGQWRAIWPAIEGFRFVLDTLRVQVSADASMAVGIVTWDSRGFDADGTDFPRPGRATVVLRRNAPGASWKGVHTHFSLFPAERRTTFGDASP